MNALIIINDAPCGTERVYNDLLIAHVLCGTCRDTRGLAGGELMEDARRGTMDELPAAAAAADKVMVS